VISPADVGGRHPFPEHIREFRPVQIDAVERVMDAWESGAKVVFLDAPTGIGKTVIAELARRQRRAERAAYICTTKSLQDQFVEDFRYAHVLKGRANYETLDAPEDFPFTSCADCVREEMSCPLCSNVDQCPYTVAKNLAVRKDELNRYEKDLIVTNTAYFLSECAYVGVLTSMTKSGPSNPFDLVIMDECDAAENALLGFVSVSISAGMRKRMGIELPAKKTVEASWIEWVVDEALPKADEYCRNLLPPTTATVKGYKAAMSALADLKRLEAGLGEEGTWVYAGETEKSSREMDAKKLPVVFKPIRVDQKANELLWRHGKRWLCMSATVISPDELAESLGLERHEWAAVGVGSGFDKKRRPIVVKPVADMSRRNKPTSWPKMALEIKKVIALYPGQNILIHTVSYELTRYLKRELTKLCAVLHRPLYGYERSEDREAVLAQFKVAGQNHKGAVMLASSFDRGVDLPADECRVVIIAKVPFPYLGDKQVAARLYSRGGRLWYDTLTVRSIVQMTGRGMRSADDWCVSIILDAAFLKLWGEKRRLLPKWWQSALVWSGRLPAVDRVKEGAAGRR
jgi:Rad3-related DNA helicase